MKIRTIKILVTALAVALVSSCGTVSSTFSSDRYTKRSLTQKESRCSAVPRVYSGVTYDLCILHSEQKFDGFSYGQMLIPVVAIDLVLSGVVDTLVLPYTVFEQANKGNLELE